MIKGWCRGGAVLVQVGAVVVFIIIYISLFSLQKSIFLSANIWPDYQGFTLFFVVGAGCKRMEIGGIKLGLVLCLS